MTNESMVHAAEERLLDAALLQVFANERGQAAVRRTPRWLLAALFLLGVTVTAATMWQARGARTEQRDEAQDPGATSIHEEVEGEGRAGIEALPVTTTNLVAKLVDPRDLQVVTRFENLRALRLWPVKTTFLGIRTGYHGSWTKPPADLLKPIAELKHLEVLRLPSDLAVTPELLTPLAGHPTLREIQLVSDDFTLDDGLVAAMAKIPELRSLHLRFVPLSGDLLLALAKLPLTSLELEFCHGLDANGWRAMRSLRSLQRLAIHDWDWNVVVGKGKQAPGWTPTPEDLGHLQELPGLRSLELLHCGVNDAQLAALPDVLTRLHLFGNALTPTGLDGLRRFSQLRDLLVDTRGRSSLLLASMFGPDPLPAAEATASALQTLHLDTLRYIGALTPTVATAIGSQAGLRDLTIECKQPERGTIAVLLASLKLHRLAWQGTLGPDAESAVPEHSALRDLLAGVKNQPELRELELRARALVDVAALADLPRLERLTLTLTQTHDGMTPALLAPLRRSTSLQDVFLRDYVANDTEPPTAAALQSALGERIRLHRHVSRIAR